MTGPDSKDSSMPHSPRRVTLINGDIRTMDTHRPLARSLMLHDGLITEVDAPYDPEDPHLDVVDLGGRTVVPGFIDSHNHLSIAALYPRWANLLTVTTVDELHTALTAQAREEPDAAWIRAANWSPELHGAFDRHVLDSLGFDRPIMLAGHSLHEGVVDSHGLDRLHISRHTPDPPAGVIVRDQAGNPTGYLVETAWSRAHAQSLAGYMDPDRWGDLIVARARDLLRDGVTAIHDAACSPQAEAIYRHLASTGQLPISVLSMPHPAAMLTHDLAERLDGPVTGEGDEWFRIGPAKLFADGGREGARSAPDDPDALASGIYFGSVEKQIPILVERGFRVAVHAVGDYAIRGCLETFQAVARRSDNDHRFRLEHVVRPRPEQIGLMRSLGVVASVQPGIIDFYGDQIIARGGSGAGEIVMPFRSYQAAGIQLAASSDDPCAPFGPLHNAITGATRRTPRGAIFGPGQTLELSEWVRAYTAGSAFAGGQENERGRLIPGLRADLVVLDGTLDSDSPPTVAETWVAGALAWSVTGEAMDR